MFSSKNSSLHLKDITALSTSTRRKLPSSCLEVRARFFSTRVRFFGEQQTLLPSWSSILPQNWRFIIPFITEPTLDEMKIRYIEPEIIFATLTEQHLKKIQFCTHMHPVTQQRAFRLSYFPVSYLCRTDHSSHRPSHCPCCCISRCWDQSGCFWDQAKLFHFLVTESRDKGLFLADRGTGRDRHTLYGQSVH